MAELSKVNVNSTDYDLKDQKSRDALVDVVNNGAKNLLRFDETSTDNNNVRFTVNADGSITATEIAARTTTAVFRMRYTDNLLSQDVRGKILSGCPSGGSDSTYKINIEQRTSPYKNYGRDTGNGLLIPDTIADDIPLYLYIQVYTTATLPLTFKPMICTKAQWAISQAYVPYGKTNAELTAENANQQLEIDYAINTGAKNILKPTLTSESTKEGITCTPNPDGTFTLNGTFPATSSQTNVYFVVVNNAELKKLSNKYGAIDVICSGGSDIDRSQGQLRFYKIDTNENTFNSSATNEEISLTLSDNIRNSSANISIVVYRGQTLNNVVIKPMIRPASITDDTFVPYAPTNRELYEEKIDHDLPVVSGSILDYSNTLAPGIYFARQGSSTGSGKPVNNRRYVYNIYVYSSATTTIMAIEGEDSSNPRMYLTNKVSGTWGPWYKFEGTEVT